MLCHAPGKLGPLGTLFVESRRHFLDYGAMTDEESISLGHVMRRIYRAIRSQTDTERIYQVTLMDGVPHFHTWLVPDRKTDSEKGTKFLAGDHSCSDQEASELARQLRASM